MLQVPTQVIPNWVERWSFVIMGEHSRGGKSHALLKENQLL